MKAYVVFVLLFVPAWVQAGSCFLVADTYYQQLYCEIQASGKGAGLPSLADFRRNNERMQALLLKPYANRAGIDIKMPVTSSQPRPVAKTISVQDQSRATACTVDQLAVTCSGKRYDLVVNQPRDRLSPGVLDSQFKLDLPVFSGSRQDAAAVNTYLLDSYRHYLDKMMAIGLGGSTLSFAKFAFLFEDLAAREVSFRDRFERMFFYLKSDRKKLQVPVRTELPREFDPAYCYPILDLITCQVGLVNLVFI